MLESAQEWDVGVANDLIDGASASTTIHSISSAVAATEQSVLTLDSS